MAPPVAQEAYSSVIQSAMMAWLLSLCSVQVWLGLRTIHSEEGIRGLWAGGVPTCMRVGLGAGIYFTCLEVQQSTCSCALPAAPVALPAGPLLRAACSMPPTREHVT